MIVGLEEEQIKNNCAIDYIECDSSTLKNCVDRPSACSLWRMHPNRMSQTSNRMNRRSWKRVGRAMVFNSGGMTMTECIPWSFYTGRNVFCYNLSPEFLSRVLCVKRIVDFKHERKQTCVPVITLEFREWGLFSSWVKEITGSEQGRTGLSSSCATTIAVCKQDKRKFPGVPD